VDGWRGRERRGRRGRVRRRRRRRMGRRIYVYGERFRLEIGRDRRDDRAISGGGVGMGEMGF